MPWSISSCSPPGHAAERVAQHLIAEEPGPGADERAESQAAGGEGHERRQGVGRLGGDEETDQHRSRRRDHRGAQRGGQQAPNDGAPCSRRAHAIIRSALTDMPPQTRRQPRARAHPVGAAEIEVERDGAERDRGAEEQKSGGTVVGPGV
jgi:hypothetical protein